MAIVAQLLQKELPTPDTLRLAVPGLLYVVQNNLTGLLEVHTEPGIHYRVPFFSTVTPYKQVRAT